MLVCLPTRLPKVAMTFYAGLHWPIRRQFEMYENGKLGKTDLRCIESSAVHIPSAPYPTMGSAQSLSSSQPGSIVGPLNKELIQENPKITHTIPLTLKAEFTRPSLIE